MTGPQLSAIHIYPIKSTAGISLSSSFVEQAGLSFDRRLMISAPDGHFITARECPKLLGFRTLLIPQGLLLIAPDGERISIDLHRLAEHYRNVEVWGDQVSAQQFNEEQNEWLSSKLGRPARLHFFGPQSQRFTSRQPDKPVGFADGYPLLLISEASLQDLNQRSQRINRMEQFRPNLVISGTEAFAEDGWKRVRIGEVEFALVKPCSRCVMTTYDPDTGQPVGDGEPLQTLQRYRKGEDNEVYFGQNLIPLNEGRIARGDSLEVLETAPPPEYANHSLIIRPAPLPATSARWQANEPARLRCVARVEETPDVVSFRFALPPTLQPDYQAGQFITLQPQIDGETVNRCYTLSSSPSRPSDLAITVKRQPDGTVSRWLHDNLQPGDEISALGPMGQFNVNSSSAEKLLLLSAGSGITPLLSICRYLSDNHSHRDIVFLHQARTEADLICRAELTWLAAQNPHLKLIFSLSQPDSAWAGPSGRLERDLLISLVPDLTERAVMCCGPKGFMDQAREASRQLGLAEQRWFQESFKAPALSEEDQQLPFADLAIRLENHDALIHGNNHQTLLEQADEQGIRMDCNCRAGICGTCKVQLVSGQVRQLATGPLSEAEKEKGVVLACSSIPLSDLVVKAV
ncbi:hybrid-cluster NAD(P)-dependent oxidoreductase [Marinobacterium jannaschii]|uniref:hybrid-cluster NAD(P)-dependent oxidoreductase n=1 Tax=Marinobacterium jannaschii TaxID=64970 RepID=UPI000488CF84|nr:hybrid-cluster NAD(P)-dependent oxidoreductase [Marinobacterium jannaschii]